MCLTKPEFFPTRGPKDENNSKSLAGKRLRLKKDANRDQTWGKIRRGKRRWRTHYTSGNIVGQ